MLFFRKKGPVVKPRAEHCVSRADIDPDALRVLYRLDTAGYKGYLVGGSVRDLLLKRTPKDFDIGTDARPNEIRKLFRNCFLVGRRFRLAHIVFGRKTIETATFRKQPEEQQVQDEHGLYQTDDNTFGSPEEDARRRDFTVNGLFYDISTFNVIDYVGGLKDLDKKLIRSIGDPNLRFREDPVRMMRAVRFAAKLEFEIDSADKRAIKKHSSEITNAPIARLCEEIFRLFVDGACEESFRRLWQFNLMKYLLPTVHDYVESTGGEKSPLWFYLATLDKAARNNALLTNAVRLGVLFYPIFLARLKKEESASGRPQRINRRQIAIQVLDPVSRNYRMPKAAWMGAVTLMEVMPRFGEEPSARNRHQRFVQHGIFEEALLFVKIAVVAEAGSTAAIDAWRTLHDKHLRSNRAGRTEDSEEDTAQEPSAPPTKRRRRRKKKPASEKATEKQTLPDFGAV